MFLTSRTMAGWSAEDATTFWDRWGMDTVMHYPVSQQCHDQLDEKQELCEDTNKINRQTFMGQRDLSDAMAASIIHTDEARNMQFWCRYQSWTYCPKCQKLETRKLQPAFRRKTPSPLHNAFKCGNSIYIVPNIEDVPLILRNRTKAEVACYVPWRSIVGNTNATSTAIASKQVPSGSVGLSKSSRRKWTF